MGYTRGKNPNSHNRGDLLTRFMSKVRIRDGHWIWIGADNGRYGQIRVLGKNEQAHRVSYELFIGEIPEGHGVLHRCDICLCVNPECLFTGTQKDNIHDMLAKGRDNSRIFTFKEAEEIRKIVGMTQADIAKEYGVSDSAIGNIIHRRTYVKDYK